MKRRIFKKAVTMMFVMAVAATSVTVPSLVKAENPVVQTMYTADPAPLVVGDTMYVYTTRDDLKESCIDDWSYMNEWRCFATKDMINYTDMGMIAHAMTFDKEDKNNENWRAWAPQAFEMPIKDENGNWVKKYFLCAPFNGTKIDLAVADNPWGPFEDYTPGKYLIDGGWGGGNIDPTVYIEDHGNPDDYENYDVYLYWGNPYLRYCKLTNDLKDVDPDTNGDGVIDEVEAAPDPRFDRQDNTIMGEYKNGLHSFKTLGDGAYEAFGEPTKKDKITKDNQNMYKFPTESVDKVTEERSCFEEGPWVYKHDDGKEGTDDYFLVFVGGRLPETCEYSTAPTPLGPWTYRGTLFDRKWNFSCIHPGVAEMNGHNYMFYLNNLLIGGDGSNRNICVKEFTYDENNLIKKETPDDEDALFDQGIEETDPEGKKFVKGNPYFSVDPTGTLNPYELNQAETICWESNLNGPEGGYNGTPLGVKTKSKQICTDIDEVTGQQAFWKSAAMYGVVVTDIDNDDFIRVRNIDFGSEGPIAFKASVACGEGTPLPDPYLDWNGKEFVNNKTGLKKEYNPDADTVGGSIEIWIDYDNEDAKKLIGTIDVTNTGGTNVYEEKKIDITEKITGVHDMTFVFTGKDNAKLFNFDTWQFETKALPSPSPEPSVVPDNKVQTGNNVSAAPIQAPQAPQAPAVETPATVAPVKLAAPKIKSIKRAGKKIKVKLKKVKGAKGYQVAVATKKNGKYKVVLKLKSSKLSGTIKGIKSNKKYFVKARAYTVSDNKKVYSNYSKVKTVKAK